MGTSDWETVTLLSLSESNISTKNHPICVNVSQFMSAKQVAKLVMLAGSFTVWNMAFNLMVRCQKLKEELEAMTLFPLSLLKLEMGNMCQEVCLLISNLQ